MRQFQLIENDTKLLLYKANKGGDFYISEMKNGDWDEPKSIKEINPKAFENCGDIVFHKA